jgi:hypothetical protein
MEKIIILISRWELPAKRVPVAQNQHGGAHRVSKKDARRQRKLAKARLKKGNWD